MREYKIIRTERGRILSRKKQMGRLMILQYLNGKGLWSPNKSFAKVYYDKDSALDVLVGLRINEGKKSD